MPKLMTIRCTNAPRGLFKGAYVGVRENGVPETHPAVPAGSEVQHRGRRAKQTGWKGVGGWFRSRVSTASGRPVSQGPTRGRKVLLPVGREKAVAIEAGGVPAPVVELRRLERGKSSASTDLGLALPVEKVMEVLGDHPARRWWTPPNPSNGEPLVTQSARNLGGKKT